MTLRSVGATVRAVYLGFTLLLFITGTDVFLAHRQLLGLDPAVLFLIMFSPLVMGMLLAEALKKPPFPKLPIVWQGVAAPFAALVLLVGSGLISAFYEEANWNEDGKFVFLPLFGCVVIVSGLVAGMSDTARRYIGRLAFAVLLVMLVSIVIDMIRPGYFSRVASRAAGLAENANLSAFIVVTLLCLVLDFDRFRKRDLIVICIAAVGTFLTLSRSGILIFGVFTGIYVLRMMQLSRRSRTGRAFVLTWTASGLILAIIGGVVLSRDTALFQDRSAQRRLAIFAGQAPLWRKDESRLRLVTEYLDRINESPVLGRGSSYSLAAPVGPHNMYLAEWTNDGLAGLLAYVAFQALLFRYFSARHSFAGITLVVLMVLNSFFSHNLMVSKPFLLVLGLQIAMAEQFQLSSRSSLRTRGSQSLKASRTAAAAIP